MPEGGVPRSADMVYLEFCFETCEELRYLTRAAGGEMGPGRGGGQKSGEGVGGLLARAYAPSCSAAVLFTAKGARKVSTLAWPIFDVIDRMYQFLVFTGLVEAYVVTPPLFYQDAFWGSNWVRSTERWHASRSHRPLSPPCGGAMGAGPFLHTDLRQVGTALSQSQVECLAPILASPHDSRRAILSGLSTDGEALGGVGEGGAGADGRRGNEVYRSCLSQHRVGTSDTHGGASGAGAEVPDELGPEVDIHIFVPDVFPVAYLELQQAPRTSPAPSGNEAKHPSPAAGRSSAPSRSTPQSLLEGGKAEITAEEHGEDEMGLRVVLYTESAFVDGVLLICGEWSLAAPPQQVGLPRLLYLRACIVSLCMGARSRVASPVVFTAALMHLGRACACRACF